MRFEEIFAEKKERKMSNTTKRIYEIIRTGWPINPLEVAELIGDNGKIKTLSAKYLYHFKKLRDIGLIKMKKIGNTYIAWPVEIEKIRVIHEIIKEM